MGFFDKLFGSKKPAKPEAVAAKAERGVVCAAVGGRVEVACGYTSPHEAQKGRPGTTSEAPE